MKFDKTNKLFIALILMYLIVFVELSQIENSIKFRLNTRRNYKNSVHRSKSNTLVRSGTNDTEEEGCAIFFSECDFKGTSERICNDSPYLDNWWDKVRSVKVDPETKLIIFQDTKYTDKAIEIIKQNSCLKEFYYTRSHIILKSNNAVLFYKCNYDGSAFKLTNSQTNFYELWKVEEFSSIIVGFKTKITLYEDNDFKGESLEVSKNIPCMDSTKLNNKVSSATIIADVFMTSNSFFNFIIGTVEGLGGNNVGFYKCFPQEFMVPVQAESLESKALEKSFQGWSDGINTFINISGFLLEPFCFLREKVMTFISGLIIFLIKQFIERKRKFRLSFLEMNSGTFKSISSFKRMVISRKMMRMTSSRVQGLFDDILNSALKNWIYPIKEKIVNFIDKVKAFFDSDLFKKIIKFIKCILSVGSLIKEMWDTLSGFVSKFENFLAASTNPITLIIIIVDYVTGLMCNWKKFKEAVNYFLNAWNNNDSRLKWLFYGKALGTFLNAIGNAPTFSELYKEIGNRLLDVKRIATDVPNAVDLL
jgi:Beta/Gamma crystallin